MKIKNENLNAINSERFVNYMWYSPKQWREWKAQGKKDKEAFNFFSIEVLNTSRIS